MELDIRKLIAQNKCSGEFDFTYIADGDRNMIPLANIIGEVKVFGEYEIFEDDSVEITLRLKYLLAGNCSYCLSPAQKEVEYVGEIVFVTDKNDTDNYTYNGLKINLKSAVDDALLFSQPSVLLCADCEKEKNGAQ